MQPSDTEKTKKNKTKKNKTKQNKEIKKKKRTIHRQLSDKPIHP